MKKIIRVAAFLVSVAGLAASRALAGDAVGGPVTDENNGAILKNAQVVVAMSYMSYPLAIWVDLPPATGLTDANGNFSIPISQIPANSIAVTGQVTASKVGNLAQWASGAYYLPSGIPINGPYPYGPIPCSRTDFAGQHLDLTYNVLEHLPNGQNAILPGATVTAVFTCDGNVQFRKQGLSDANGNFQLSFDNRCAETTTRQLNLITTFSGTPPCNSSGAVQEIAPAGVPFDITGVTLTCFE